jgi:hypothetical protein
MSARFLCIGIGVYVMASVLGWVSVGLLIALIWH